MVMPTRATPNATTPESVSGSACGEPTTAVDLATGAVEFLT